MGGLAVGVTLASMEGRTSRTVSGLSPFGVAAD